MSLISIILAPISRYCPDVRNSKEKALFYQGGNLPQSLILWRTLEVEKEPRARTLYAYECSNKLIPVVNGALISFILKCYSLFRVNFLYWEVAFPLIRVNLSRVNFKYLN